MQTWGKGFADGQGYEYLYYKMDAILVEIWCHWIPQYLTQSPKHNKVICKVRQLGADDGQFWHNRASNA
jgi:hypothetical protein